MTSAAEPDATRSAATGSPACISGRSSRTKRRNAGWRSSSGPLASSSPRYAAVPPAGPRVRRECPRPADRPSPRAVAGACRGPVRRGREQRRPSTSTTRRGSTRSSSISTAPTGSPGPRAARVVSHDVGASRSAVSATGRNAEGSARTRVAWAADSATVAGVNETADGGGGGFGNSQRSTSGVSRQPGRPGSCGRRRSSHGRTSLAWVTSANGPIRSISSGPVSACCSTEPTTRSSTSAIGPRPDAWQGPDGRRGRATAAPSRRSRGCGSRRRGPARRRACQGPHGPRRRRCHQVD